jgi:hypothetical protein
MNLYYCGDTKMENQNNETMTVHEFGEAAAERGVRPSVLLAEYELQREPSARRA